MLDSIKGILSVWEILLATQYVLFLITIIFTWLKNLRMHWYIMISIAKRMLIITVSVFEKVEVTKTTLFRNRFTVSINIYTFKIWFSIVEQHFDYEEVYKKTLFNRKWWMVHPKNISIYSLNWQSTIDNFELKKLSNFASPYIIYIVFFESN